jgi:hypothetical protein
MTWPNRTRRVPLHRRSSLKGRGNEMVDSERHVLGVKCTIYDVGIIFDANVRIDFGFLFDVFLPKTGVIFNA